MTKLMRKREKIRAQMKSRFYYMFWGAMAKSMNRWFEETIDIIVPDRGYYQPMPSGPEYPIIR